MLTSDLALRLDPVYEQITRRWLDNPEEMSEAFAKAWYKLLHRDMGPVSRFVGPWVPEQQLWQDPVPAVDHELIDDKDIEALTEKILDSGLSVQQLVSTAWAAASSFRGTDLRGGANGGRIRLAPQKDWEANEPAELAKAIQALEQVQQDFNSSASGGKKVSFADIIVLGGSAAIAKAAKDAGHEIDGAVLARPYRRHPGGDRRRVVRLAEDERRRVPQLPAAGREDASGAPAAREGLHAGSHRAGDDRPDRRSAGVGRQPRRQQARCLH